MAFNTRFIMLPVDILLDDMGKLLIGQNLYHPVQSDICPDSRMVITCHKEVVSLMGTLFRKMTIPEYILVNLYGRSLDQFYRIFLCEIHQKMPLLFKKSAIFDAKIDDLQPYLQYLPFIIYNQLIAPMDAIKRRIFNSMMLNSATSKQVAEFFRNHH